MIRFASQPLGVVAAMCLSLASNYVGADPDMRSGPPLCPGTGHLASSSPKVRPWTVQDIVEVTRITGIAVRGNTDVTAYLLEQPCLSDGKNHFALFVVQPGASRSPRMILETSYIGDLTWHPGTQNWTVLADFGSGVQLYDVTDDGGVTTVVANPETTVVGGDDGLVISPIKEPRNTGVLSYEWAPGGRKLWYSRLRLHTASVQQAKLSQGIRYDETTMVGAAPQDVERSVRLSGTELHVLDPVSSSDRIIAEAPNDPTGNYDVFRRDEGSVVWVDPDHLQYRFREGASGYLKSPLWRIDVAGGEPVPFPTATTDQVYYSVPTREGILTLAPMAGQQHVVNMAPDGRILTDYGPPPFLRVAAGAGIWRDPRDRRFVVGVHFYDHDGLAAVSPASRSVAITNISDHLSGCAFNLDLSYGACSRESLSAAPELVSLDGSLRKTTVLDRPNARYDEIRPLKSTPANWVNRYGSANTGYITYPRNYIVGKQYPAIVITHARDAKNQFVQDGFQWEFPIQVFAERDYFVLSVNEPLDKGNTPPPYAPGAPSVGVVREQFQQAYNPLATMEEAAGALLKTGSVQPSKIGIAGYSRGSTIARFALSHSSVFSVGSTADATWWDAGGYWEGGALGRTVYQNLFGGAPFNPAAYQNYLAFSSSARAWHFAGPLLQQFTLANAKEAVEMDQMLKGAHIPTELYIFASEAHVFWQPLHRAAAMEQNLDWFDFWLTGSRDPNPDKREQYERWERMASEWQRAVPNSH